MATLTFADVPIGEEWLDLVSVIPALANADAKIASVGSVSAFIVSGGAERPDLRDGDWTGQPVSRPQGEYASADHVWARTNGPPGAVSVTLF